MSTPDNKPAAKKPAAKKPAAKKPAAKKPAAKKPAAKKPAAKKPAAKKPAAKKPAPAFDTDKVGEASMENLQLASMEIDRQMKELASIDTRVLLAKDTLAEIQQLIQVRTHEFQEKNTAAAKKALSNAKKRLENHKDFMSTIRTKRDEAAKALKDSETIHKTYESIVKHLEKGKETAIKEAKKAEVAFMKKLHEIEAQMLKQVEKVKKNLKD